MTEYKPNSRLSKEQTKENEEKKEIKKVVNGTVRRKKNNVRKLTDIFISEDVTNVKSYIFMDVLVPAMKKAISDIVTDGIDMLLYGSANRKKKSNAITGSYTNYGFYSTSNRNDRGEYNYRQERYTYDDIYFDDRRDAEAVLMQMDECIDRYGRVSVMDLYDLVGITGEYTDAKFGWTNLHSAEVVRDMNGKYKIKLSRPKAFDR